MCRRRWSATLSGSLVFFLSALFFFLCQLRVVCYFKYLIIVSSFPISFRHILTRKTPLDINVTCSKKKRKTRKRQNRRGKVKAKLHLELMLELMMSWRRGWGWGWDNRWQASFALETWGLCGGGGAGGVGSCADRHLADLAMEDGKLKIWKAEAPGKHTLGRSRSIVVSLSAAVIGIFGKSREEKQLQPIRIEIWYEKLSRSSVFSLPPPSLSLPLALCCFCCRCRVVQVNHWRRSFSIFCLWNWRGLLTCVCVWKYAWKWMWKCSCNECDFTSFELHTHTNTHGNAAKVIFQ